MSRRNQAIALLESELFRELVDNFRQMQFEKFTNVQADTEMLASIHSQASAVNNFALYLHNECRDIIEDDANVG